MPQKQIHELNTYSGTPAAGTYFAADNGATTTKLDYDALATAIIAKLGGNPVTIAHGGTGATSAADARTALSVYTKAQTDSAIAASIATSNLSSSVTPSTTYVDESGQLETRCYRTGNVVTFHFTFKAAANSVDGQPIFSGLPRAYNADQQFVAYNATTKEATVFAIRTNGTLQTHYAGNGFKTGNLVRGSVTYITNA